MKMAYTSIEIDESSIIANSQVVYSMFGLIQRSSKDAHIFYVINNRTKEKLLPYVIYNATTAYQEKVDNNEDMSCKK
jgi:hypothetical protein